MKRRVVIAALAVVGLLSTGLYFLEYEVKQMERQLARLDDGLRQDRQAIQVLRAEWSYLTTPDRLQKLAAKHRRSLDLSPASPAQITGLADLPVRPAPVTIAQSSDGAWPVPMVKPMYLRLGIAGRGGGRAQ